jgi:hypothetical protein
MRLTILGILISISSAPLAGEILMYEVSHSDKVYSLEFEATINGPFERVHQKLTEYQDLHLLSDAVLESEIIDTNDESARLHLLIKTCILIFCFKKNMVADVYEPGPGEFHAVNIAELGDFEPSQGAWQLTPIDDSKTKILFKGEVIPRFWIPPVIGPVLIENKMKRIASNSIEKLELQLLND